MSWVFLLGPNTPYDLTVERSSRYGSFMQSGVSHAQDCYGQLMRMNREGKDWPFLTYYDILKNTT